MGVEFKLSGLPDMRRALADIPGKLRRKALQDALKEGARLIRNTAKSLAPVLQPQRDDKGRVRKPSPYRKKGTLKKAIAVRTSKLAKRAGNVGVFVNVRPAKKGQRSAKNPRDPYYWKFQEFGFTPHTGPRKGKAATAAKRQRRLSLKRGEARQIAGKRFLTRAAAQLPEALRIFQRRLSAEMHKLNIRGSST